MNHHTAVRRRWLIAAASATGTFVIASLLFGAGSVSATVAPGTTPSVSPTPAASGAAPTTAPPSGSPGGSTSGPVPSGGATTPPPFVIDFSDTLATDWSVQPGITASMVVEASGNMLVRFDGVSRYGEIGRYTIRDAPLRKGYQYALSAQVRAPSGQPRSGFTMSRPGYPGSPGYATATGWAQISTTFIATGLAAHDAAIDAVLSAALRCDYDPAVPATAVELDNLSIQQLGLVPATTVDPVPTTGPTPTWQCTIPPVTPPIGTVVGSWDFEDGTTQEWTGVGSGRVSVTGTAHTGDHSLLVEGTGGTTSGASVAFEITTMPVGYYRITGQVIRTDGGPPVMVAAASPWSQVTSYQSVGGQGWTELTGYDVVLSETFVGERTFTSVSFLIAPLSAGDALSPVSLAVDDVTVTWIGTDEPDTGCTAGGGCPSPSSS